MKREATDVYPVKFKGKIVYWSADDKSPGYTPADGKQPSAISLPGLILIGAGSLALMVEIMMRLGF